MFDVLTTYAEAALFSKLVYFSTCLAGWFHNFELTQNREKKQEMALSTGLKLSVL
jgi:hypothetical protein